MQFITDEEADDAFISIWGSFENVPVWFNDGEFGLQFNAKYSRQLWKWKRCMDKDQKIDCRDVMNPGHCPLVELVVDGAATPGEGSTKAPPRSFDEDEDDDEGW